MLDNTDGWTILQEPNRNYTERDYAVQNRTRHVSLYFVTVHNFLHMLSVGGILQRQEQVPSVGRVRVCWVEYIRRVQFHKRCCFEEP